ncbi:MAG: non-homologous end-joining DNA ligase [Verrucomicrobiota bacterium]
MSETQELEFKGRKVTVTNTDKVFYPESGFTKGQMIDYYLRIAPVLLPHLKGRAVSLKRYPDGVEGFFFYEKQCPQHAPKWLKTTPVKRSDGEIIDYCLLNDTASLAWAANIANLELHPFLHQAKAPTRPKFLVFDLDPGPPADVLDCCRVAVWIRDLFAALDLRSFIKTSGSKGLQLVVPLNTPVTYAKTKAFAHTVADTLADRFPDKVVSDMKKSLRTGKVLIDWSQNDDSKTTVCVYSLRAKTEPTVSTPVTWDEIERALKRRRRDLLIFRTEDVLKRVEKLGDLFEPILTLKQKLPTVDSLAGD